MFCISVPIKTNTEFLATALGSLRTQTAPLAVALLDASGDPAVAGIADRSGLDYAWRRHGPDAGQAAAIGEGWRRAPGEIVGWLNADDMLLPGALDAAAAIFAAEPETDLVFGHAVMLDAAGAFTGYFPSISADPENLRTSNTICQPACFVRRSAVARVGGLDTGLHYAMDWDLWLRLLDSGARFRFVDVPLAAVRCHPATKTRSGGDARRREVERLMAPRLRWRDLVRLRLGMALEEAAGNDRRLRAAALRTMFAAARAGRAGAPRPAPLFGLDRATNRVERRCRLVMPVADAGDRVDLIVHADRKIALRAFADGMVARSSGEPGGDLHAARLPGIVARDNLVRCEIESTDGPWRLVKVVAAPAARAGASGPANLAASPERDRLTGNISTA
jgi:GT2 family glycosyltransferase